MLWYGKQIIFHDDNNSDSENNYNNNESEKNESFSKFVNTGTNSDTTAVSNNTEEKNGDDDDEPQGIIKQDKDDLKQKVTLRPSIPLWREKLVQLADFRQNNNGNNKYETDLEANRNILTLASNNFTKPPAGTQMGSEQIALIQEALGKHGNLLVWGLGNDSPFWNYVTTGRVAFIEDDIPEAKAGTLWYDVITRKYPFLEAYKVKYHTDNEKSFQQYITSPERWPELRLKDLPNSIREEHWDVIIVDAPLGCCNAGPGRYQSIYESWRMATNKTHVFVDDYERKVEREFSQAVLGRAPDSVVPRQKAASNANEQAHFRPVTPQRRYDQVPNSIPIQWTILLTVNDGFYDFFQNWWIHYDRLKLLNTVVVVAEDDAVYAKLKVNLNITVERSSLINANAHSYESTDYKVMVSTRAQHILRHLRVGEDVLYSDVDTVWRSDPMVHLVSQDIVAEVDNPTYEGVSPYYCTGFMAIHSNARTIRMMEQWNNEMTRKPQLNQPLFNRVLHGSKTVEHVGLPNALFPSGKQYFDEMDENVKQKVVVVHNNFIQGHGAKKKRFQAAGLWQISTNRRLTST